MRARGWPRLAELEGAQGIVHRVRPALTIIHSNRAARFDFPSFSALGQCTLPQIAVESLRPTPSLSCSSAFPAAAYLLTFPFTASTRTRLAGSSSFLDSTRLASHHSDSTASLCSERGKTKTSRSKCSSHFSFCSHARPAYRYSIYTSTLNIGGGSTFSTDQQPTDVHATHSARLETHLADESDGTQRVPGLPARVMLSGRAVRLFNFG